MNCVSCGRPIALPTPDPFRCTVCRPLIVRAETAEKAETIMKELLEQERQSGATLARSLSEADETCDALRAELETERAACEMVRAELRGTSQRLADVNVKDSVKTREINILTKENRTLVADFTTLTQEIAQVVREFDEVVDGAIGNVPTEHLVIMTSQLRAALSRSLYSTEHTQPSDAVGAALVGAEPPADQVSEAHQPPAVHHLCGPNKIGVTGPPHASWCYHDKTWVDGAAQQDDYTCSACGTKISTNIREWAVSAPPDAASPRVPIADPGRFALLALFGARIAHENLFDAAVNIDDEPTEGHENHGRTDGDPFGFNTCPHPDCVMVRRAASPRVGAPAEKEKNHADIQK